MNLREGKKKKKKRRCKEYIKIEVSRNLLLFKGKRRKRGEMKERIINRNRRKVKKIGEKKEKRQLKKNI